MWYLQYVKYIQQNAGDSALLCSHTPILLYLVLEYINIYLYIYISIYIYNIYIYIYIYIYEH